MRKDKKQVTFYIDDKTYDLFQKKYPYVTSLFLRRCIYSALDNKDMFDKIFFETSDDFLRFKRLKNDN